MKARILLLILCTAFIKAYSQTPPAEDYTEVYGFAMVDAGYNFDQIKPTWYDAMRPSRLPSYTNQYGTDGNTYISARQSRFGIKTGKHTDAGNFKAVFDFDMYGVGVDEGQTTIRLRHAYGQFGHWGGGLTESAFMDLDVFPNTFEYWGPNGMMFLRNVQLRWQPIMSESQDLTFAVEAPGASADRGETAGDPRVDLSGVKSRYPYPDISGHYRSTHGWGYIQIGAIYRDMEWEDLNKTATTDLTGKVTGWGVSLSSNLKFGKDVLRLQVADGAGIENYFNDAPIDVGTTAYDSANTKTPVKGEALGDLGVVVFLDHTWNEKWTTSVGGSYVDITNSAGQNYDAYSAGSYAAANVIYSPIPAVLMGLELQYVSRDNYKTSPVDGFTGSSATKVNISFKYSFSQKLH